MCLLSITVDDIMVDFENEVSKNTLCERVGDIPNGILASAAVAVMATGVAVFSPYTKSAATVAMAAAGVGAYLALRND